MVRPSRSITQVYGFRLIRDLDLAVLLLLRLASVTISLVPAIPIRSTRPDRSRSGRSAARTART